MQLSGLTAQITGLELLKGQKSETVDFSYTRGFIVVKMRYAGFFPLSFIFDTGAQNTIFFDRFTAELVPVQYDRVIQITGSDLSGAVSARIARNMVLKLANLPEVRRDVIVLEEDYIQMAEMIGEPVHGILGADFFKGLIIEINYKKQQLKLFDAKSFDKQYLSEFTAIDAEFADSKPYLNASVTMPGGQQANVKLLMDTGASISMLIHNDTDPSLVLPPHVIRGNLGKGISGSLIGYAGRIRSFSFERFRFEQMVSYFQEYDVSLHADSSVIRRNGIIGNFLLDRFRVVIDYLGHKIYLKPQKKYNRKFTYDRSGLVVFAHGRDLRAFVINDVIEGSPAWQAGIRPNDIITRLGYTNAANLSLDKINRKLSGKEGKKIKIKVLRDGKNLEFEIRLRELL